MRKLIALLTIFSFNAYAVAPTGVGGEDGALSYTNNLKAPAYTITSLGGVNSRIESGNTNLLMNPSFEHTAVATGYTGSNFTATADTTNQVEGKKAISLAISGGTLGFGQSSSINAANLVGLQGVVSIKIKTSLTDVKVCPMNAGTEVSSLCVNVTSNNSWKHVVIPFILSATSNGFKVKTTSSTSGTVIVDDAFVGTSAPFQDVSGARLVGACTTTLGSDQSSTSATYATLSAASSISVVTYGQGQAPSTNTTGCKFASIPAGDYTIIWDGEFGNQTTGARSFFSVSDGTNQSTDEVGIIGSAGFGGNTMTARISYSTAQSNITFVPVAKIQTGISFIKANTKQTFKLYYFPPATKIYSQASQDYDWTAYTPTFTGFGTTASNECYHKRKGSDLYLKCKFISGTPTATEARVSFPGSLVASAFGSIRYAGPLIATTSTSAPTKYVLSEQSVGYLTFGRYASLDTLAFSKQLGNSFGSGDTISFETGPIPIQGWSDYGVIVGSFAGLEKCANDYECTDTFSAQVSATGVVSNENIDWINGNCSNPSASNYTCTFLTNTLKDGSSALVSPMNCVVTRDQATAVAGYVDPRVTSTTTGLTVQTPSPVSTNVNQPFSIKCQKGSQDYKPKTAKVADSAVLFPVVSSVTALDIDWSKIKVATGFYTKTLSSNSTFTFSNPTAGQSINILLTNTASNYTVTWPAVVKWSGGTAPTMTTGAKSDIYSIFYDGSNYYGTYVQNY